LVRGIDVDVTGHKGEDWCVGGHAACHRHQAWAMEASIAHIDNNLAALLRRLDDHMTWEHDWHQGQNNNNNNYDEQVYDNWDEYSADSELDDHDAHRPVHHKDSIDDVRYTTMMMLIIKSSLKYHFLTANMIQMLIFLGNWLLNKNLHALNFLKMLGLE
jgi:hypothetical protein